MLILKIGMHFIFEQYRIYYNYLYTSSALSFKEVNRVVSQIGQNVNNHRECVIFRTEIAEYFILISYPILSYKYTSNLVRMTRLNNFMKCS